MERPSKKCGVSYDLLSLPEVIEDDCQEKLIMMASALCYLDSNNTNIQRRIDYLSSLLSD